MENQASDNKKAKHTFSGEEAVKYLRRLADQLESGAIEISNEEMEFQGQIKVKESLKSKKGKTSVKVQFKLSIQEVPPESAADEAPQENTQEPASEMDDEKKADEATLSYKKLKKLMDVQFKEIGKSLEQGEELSLEKAQAFYQSCLQMVVFKDADKGEELYPDFEAKARAFYQAAEDGDLERLNKAYADLKAMKKACHKQFK